MLPRPSRHVKLCHAQAARNASLFVLGPGEHLRNFVQWPQQSHWRLDLCTEPSIKSSPVGPTQSFCSLGTQMSAWNQSISRRISFKSWRCYDALGLSVAQARSVAELVLGVLSQLSVDLSETEKALYMKNQSKMIPSPKVQHCPPHWPAKTQKAALASVWVQGHLLSLLYSVGSFPTQEALVLLLSFLHLHCCCFAAGSCCCFCCSCSCCRSSSPSSYPSCSCSC